MLRGDAEGAGGHHLNQAPRMDAPGLDSQTWERTNLSSGFPGKSDANPSQIAKQPAEVKYVPEIGQGPGFMVQLTLNDFRSNARLLRAIPMIWLEPPSMSALAC